MSDTVIFVVGILMTLLFASGLVFTVTEMRRVNPHLHGGDGKASDKIL